MSFLQIGPYPETSGPPNAGLRKAGCNAYDPPVVPFCNGGWEYQLGGGRGWRVDDTLSLVCKGGNKDQ